jgi:hypothetical protein
VSTAPLCHPRPAAAVTLTPLVLSLSKGERLWPSIQKDRLQPAALLPRRITSLGNFCGTSSVNPITASFGSRRNDWMKRWIVPLASLSAVAAAVVLALFLAGVFDGDGASASLDTGAGDEQAGVCVEGNPGCGDTGFVTDDDGGGTVAPGCEVGYVGVCNDTPIEDGETGDLFEGDGPAIQPVCAPGFPDCEDMIVVTPADGEPEPDR